ELANCVQNSKPSNGLPLYNFLDNHDQPRIASNIKNPAFLNLSLIHIFTNNTLIGKRFTSSDNFAVTELIEKYSLNGRIFFLSRLLQNLCKPLGRQSHRHCGLDPQYVVIQGDGGSSPP
ncbi:hypothetical protein, partial [Treponema sp. R8-4-B8]